MPNYGYHLARAHGAAVRKLYQASLPQIAPRKIAPPSELPFDVVTYSSEAMLPEQVACIRSFLRHAGRPRRFLVVSDGTHSPASRALLYAIDRTVSVEPAPELPASVPASMRDYLTAHPTGKQLALIMSLPRPDGPALYLDADVLFFPRARDIVARLMESDVPAIYLSDCQLSADERLFANVTEQADPVNTGVLFFRRPLDWAIAIERFSKLGGAPTFFTNQTLTHLVMHSSNATAFPADKFVLQLDDQFIYPDCYAGPEIVLRHYVNPVRHKFWTSLARS